MNFGIRRAPAPGPDEITVKDLGKALAPIFIAQGLKIGIMWGIGHYARKALEERLREQNRQKRQEWTDRDRTRTD